MIILIIIITWQNFKGGWGGGVGNSYWLFNKKIKHKKQKANWIHFTLLDSWIFCWFGLFNFFFDKSVKELLQECSQELHHILSSGKLCVFTIFAGFMTIFFFIQITAALFSLLLACLYFPQTGRFQQQFYNFIARWDSLTSKLPVAIATFTCRNNVESENCNVYQSDCAVYCNKVCPWCS